jgi:hypothetical protein
VDLTGVSRLRITLRRNTQRAANVVGVRFSAALFNATVRRPSVAIIHGSLGFREGRASGG